MAVTSIAPTPANHPDIHISKWAWAALTTSQVGMPLGSSIFEQHANFADRSVQVTGTFGTGGSVQIEGSNDGGTTYNIMNDAFGNALVLTSGVIKQITETAERIRPNVTAGDATTAINVNLFMRKIFE
jgi:hypothetical protein